MNEQQRLTDWVNNQAPAPPAMLLTVQGVHDPTRSLASVVDVMQAVLTIPAPLWEEGQESHWSGLLPEWFVTGMTRYTSQQVMAQPEQWHFESWVATMCARQWEW